MQNKVYGENIMIVTYILYEYEQFIAAFTLIFFLFSQYSIATLF